MLAPYRHVVLVLTLLALAVASARAESVASDTARASSPFFDPDDGMLDISKFMEQRYGFLPIPFPITEPAVGYGGGGMLVFIDKPRSAGQAGFGRPNISLVGGLGTVVGPVIGAVFLVSIGELFRERFLVGHLIFYGLVMMLVIRYLPEGIWGGVRRAVSASR